MPGRSDEQRGRRRLRLGMVGGGAGALVGPLHRMAARLDDRYELVAGVFSSDPLRSQLTARELRIAPERCYADFAQMAYRESLRADRIDVVTVVTPNHLHHAVASIFVGTGTHVICEKPMTKTVAEAQELVTAVERAGVAFAVAHHYAGYRMVREARALVADGALGRVRAVYVEYLQDWLHDAAESGSAKQAQWRTDPERSGIGGCVADIGSHAFHLAEFVTGLEIVGLASEVVSFVAGRRVDDHVSALLRFSNGARGVLAASQVACGSSNGLAIRVSGEKGSLRWLQEYPNDLEFTVCGAAPRRLTRGGPGALGAPGRTPAGHPEGFIEALAQLYTDFAEQIHARQASLPVVPAVAWVPTVRDGARAMQFIHAALESARRSGAWVGIDPAAGPEAGRGA
jgi:predicted dehydrogenase